MPTRIMYDLHDLSTLPQNGSFRSLQVAECMTCAARTNLITIRLRHLHHHQSAIEYTAGCRYSHHDWHSHLLQKIGMRNPLHPKIYSDALESEIEVLRKSAERSIQHDVIGDAEAVPSLETYEIPETEFSIQHSSLYGADFTKMILSPKITVTRVRRSNT